MRRLVTSTALLCSVAIAAACTSAPRPPASATGTAEWRTVKDDYLRDGADTPITAEKRAEFLPLSYFPIDESYDVPAMLSPSAREPALEMPTSTGKRRMMRRAGTLRFSLKGESLELTAFVEADARDMNRLFVPFGDMTNGTETYAAGRYLDLDRTATSIYAIDFNRAYHPYCYYNPSYDCPYPPSENRLQLPVRAGERVRPST